MALARVRKLPLPYLTIVLGAVGTMAPLGIDGFLPAISSAARDLGTDTAGIQVTLGAFTIGFALGQTVHGPHSDKVGRRRAMLMAMGLMVLASLGCAAAPDLDALIAARAVQGFAGAAGMNIVRAVVRDLAEREAAAKLLSYVTLTSGLGPIVFPVAAGFIEVDFGWRVVFLAMAIYVAAAAAVFAVLMPETNRAPNPQAMAPARMWLAWRAVLRDGAFLRYLGCNCFTQGGLYAFLAASPKVLMTDVGVTPDRYGIYFALATCGFLTFTLVAGRLVGRLGIDRTIRYGAFFVLVAGAAMAILAYVAEPSVAAVIVPMAVYLCGFGFIVPAASAAALTPFPQIAGAASSMMGFLQQASGAVITFAIAYIGATQEIMGLLCFAAGLGIVVLALSAKRVV
jgi:DHA1 family bicyclomycin/chloramphenicol resistance-like MFS transporter